MKTYRVFLMDADETLFDFKKAEAEGLKNALAEHGIVCTPEIHARYHKINDGLWKQLERGEVTRENLLIERFVRLAEEFSLVLDAVAFNQTYMRCLGEGSFLFDGAEEICRGLCARGAKLYIVTNGTAPVQHRRFAKCPATECFEKIFISEEIGAAKPERAFFDRVLAEIPGVGREEMLIVGDSLSSDIAGGAVAGIDTCWYNPAGKENTSPHSPTYEIRSLEELYKFL